MPYNPAEKISLRVEIDVNGTRIDITSRSRAASCRINQGRTPSATQAESARLVLDIGNDDGWLTEDNPESPWYGYWGRGCPIYVYVDDVLVSAAQRFAGQVDTIALRWDAHDKCVAVVDALGTLGVLAQNDEPLRSAPYRWLERQTAPAPVACWALEDGALVDVGKPLFGQYPMQPFVGTHPSGGVFTYPRWGQGQLAPWLPPVISRTVTTGLTGMWAKVSMPGFTNTWTVDVTYASGTDAPENVIDINPSYLGGSTGWPQLTFNCVGREILVSFNGLPETIISAPTLYDGLAHLVRWEVSVTGGDTTWGVYLDGALLDNDTIVGYAQGAITRIGHVANASTGSGPLAIGYLTVWTDSASLLTFADAVSGHSGETEGLRIVRLCQEQDVPVDVVSIGSVAMGPQRPDQFVALLRECEAAGQGFLHDFGTDGALCYRAASALYNQSADLAITAGSVQPDLSPTWDNQYASNDITSSRPDGGFVRVTDEAHVARRRTRLRASPVVNVASDERLPHDAYWRVHVGTAPGARYPSVGLNLRNRQIATYADAVLEHTICDRMTVAASALPAQASPDGIDVVTVGWTEILDADRWEFRPNVVPYSPYEVFKVADQTRGRVQTAGTVLQKAETSSATSMRFATHTGPLWITSAARAGDFPFDTDVAGEQARVTAMASATAPTFVGTGSSSTGSAGSRTPGMPASVAADDLVLIWASTRNSGTGTVDTPAGWTQLYASGNTALLGRVYDGAWSMPTVTFSNGAANEDTIAQSAAFRSMCPDLSNIVKSGTALLNASAQDITLPNLTVRQDRCVVLYLAWKQDDMTGATSAPAGFTEMQEVTTILGNDASQVWGYAIQTTQADIIAGTSPTTITITGGAAAISRGLMVALVGGYQVATVSRSINAVSKAQAAGAPVSLWRPTALAL